MRSTLRDLKLSVRLFRTSPGWTFAAVATLALGVSSATLAFSVLDQVLWATPAVR